MVTQCSEVTDSEDINGLIFIANTVIRIFQIVIITLILLGFIIVYGCRKSQDRPRLVNIMYMLALSSAAAILFEFVIFILINEAEKDKSSSD